MHQTDNETSADLFLTKACEEVWVQRILALAPELKQIHKVANSSAFCYAMATGRVIFGIPVYELPDSYLIALPAVLFNEDGKVRGSSMVSEPIVKLFKSSLIFMSACAEKHAPIYYSYVNSKKRLLQGLFTESCLVEIEEIAREHDSATAFSGGVSQEDLDDELEDDDSEDSDKDVRSTMPSYYNKPTRH